MSRASDSRAVPLLELSAIDKSFGGVAALRGAGLRLFAGEVHTLMGQNGAGKSTLIKVLSGLYAPDGGRIALDGKAVQPGSVQHGQRLGISTVYQEVNLCPNLSVAENIFIGRYPRRRGAIDWRAMHAQAQVLLARLQVHIDVGAPLGSFPLALQQMVAIARALGVDARVLILDEPTSSLDEAEVQLLFDVLRTLRAQGMAILFVTHFLDQTFAISDRITVMRNGEREGEYLCSELSRLSLVNKMVGQAQDAARPAPAAMHTPEAARDGAPLLRVRGLGRRGVLKPFDMTLHAGQALGLCGLLGSGRTEAARLLYGADRADAGVVEIDGKPCSIGAPRAAITAGIGFCSEDRKHEGALLELSVRENIILTLQARRGLLRAIPFKRQCELAAGYVKALGIKTASIETAIGALSGGNQQKVLLARAMAAEPRLLILDEPTRGIDVSAKQDIMDYVAALCRKGLAILFISSELPEVLRCSDRMVVVRDRELGAEYARGALDDSSVLHAIAGEAA